MTLLSYLVSIPLGIRKAVTDGSQFDTWTSGVIIVAYAIPGFMFAILFWSFAAPWWSWPVGKLADVHVALAVLGVGIVGTLIPFFLAVGAVRVLSPAMAGIAATVEPPFAAGFAWIFLGQHLSLVQILGGVLVLAGVALSQRAPAVSKRTIAIEVAP